MGIPMEDQIDSPLRSGLGSGGASSREPGASAASDALSDAATNQVRTICSICGFSRVMLFWTGNPSARHRETMAREVTPSSLANSLTFMPFLAMRPVYRM